jgi:hypothetical protein
MQDDDKDARLEAYIAEGRAKIAEALGTHPGAPLTAILDASDALLRHLFTRHPSDVVLPEQAPEVDAAVAAAAEIAAIVKGAEGAVATDGVAATVTPSLATAISTENTAATDGAPKAEGETKSE